MTRHIAIVAAALLVTASASAQVSLPLTLDEARARAVAQVPDVAVQRYTVQLATQAERRAEAAFDSVLRLDSRLRSRTDVLNTLFSGAPDGALGPRTTQLTTTVTWSKLFAQGATVSGHTSAIAERTNSLFALLTPAYQAAVGIDVRQPLGQGRRTNAPRLQLRLTSLDATRTQAQLRRTLSELVASVEQAYWALAAARQEVGVHERAVALAVAQRRDVETRIEAGVAAEADLATSDAAISTRRTAVIGATERAARAELALKALMAAEADAGIWEMRLELIDTPAAVVPPVEVAALVDEALAERPELADVDALVSRASLEHELAADRLRPQVDLVGGYTLRGLAGRENPNIRVPFPGGSVAVPDELQGVWTQTLENALAHRFVDASVGISVILPLGNRAARADAVAAEIAREQTVGRRRGVAVRVAHEVRLAASQLEAAHARRVSATEARIAAARQLAAEQDRDLGGVSSAFVLLTRQTDLAQAELAEVAAEADAARALTELDRATGRLLRTRGIDVAQEDRR